MDQFHSGLALSVLLTPAAIITRAMSHDLSLMHPFTLAHRRPMRCVPILSSGSLKH